ncbi:TetR/AcrR family transcriptional regulator [Pseudomaricurvus alkylphenolicus]|uniref:TetR/AcrR family transcriptional regulator n=1 Tax=Pseudomaricurvus alkylphenolicus TaxID=1306991 RepID=UPI001424727F|nr:TetR/AcrR family transcriptional regulator [Pseudomaricurvus alkylphenolicus]NIB40507.1 TetR/AcrR family transcriptional regulator [Pseudomaricurvus alkylphenolicus]
MTHSTKPRRRGRPKSDDRSVSTREEILDGALAAFAELGYDGMSMRVLAARIGISHGLIPARFGTKEALWRAAVDQGMERLADNIGDLSDVDTAAEKLRIASSHLLLSLWEFPAILQLINSEGSRDSERLDYILATPAHENMRTRLQEIIDEGVAAGEFRPVSASLVFLMIAHGGGAALCLKPLSTKIDLLSTANDEQHHEIVASVADVVVRGISHQSH